MTADSFCSKSVRVILTLLAICLFASRFEAEATIRRWSGLPRDCGRVPLHNRNRDQYVNHKIAGGYDSKRGEFPSYVQVKSHLPDRMISLCGGTLISDQYIITAAHCVMRKGKVVVSIGYRASERIKELATDLICPMKTFAATRYRVINDMAIIRLAKPVQFNDQIQPVCLPDTDIDGNIQAYTVGLGAIGFTQHIARLPKVLQVLPVKRVRCDELVTHESTICFRAEERTGDPCTGDSGGPIYAKINGRQTLVGITSFGVLRCKAGYSNTSVNANPFLLADEIDEILDYCH